MPANSVTVTTASDLMVSERIGFRMTFWIGIETEVEWDSKVKQRVPEFSIKEMEPQGRGRNYVQPIMTMWETGGEYQGPGPGGGGVAVEMRRSNRDLSMAADSARWRVGISMSSNECHVYLSTCVL